MLHKTCRHLVTFSFKNNKTDLRMLSVTMQALTHYSCNFLLKVELMIRTFTKIKRLMKINDNTM